MIVDARFHYCSGGIVALQTSLAKLCDVFCAPILTYTTTRHLWVACGGELPIPSGIAEGYLTLISLLLSHSPWMLQCSTAMRTPGFATVTEKVAWGWA